MTKAYADKNQSITGQWVLQSGITWVDSSCYITRTGDDMVFSDPNIGGTKTLTELTAAGWPPTVTSDLDMQAYNIQAVDKIGFGFSGTPSYQIDNPSGTVYTLKLITTTSSSARLKLPVGSNMYG